jgi:hypothetical protein
MNPPLGPIAVPGINCQSSTHHEPAFAIEAFTHTCVLMDCLAAIACIAAQEKLRFIPLKGAAMIIGGYAGAINRPMTDIDILVKKTELQQWHRLLLENGYGPLPWSKSSFIKLSAAPTVFDLHTTLRFLTSDLVDLAWKAAIKKIYAMIAYELLPLEIDILYQCLHMTVTHGYGNEKWLRDMDALIRAHAPAIDCDALTRYAADCRAESPLTATLMYLQERSLKILENAAHSG